ncbi:MAG TPA: TldD/PmbA family protein [Bryobacteraceae bacterium]|nr:TldD/PmbA family protein [Bryobacteraceae bacterium]
MTVSRRDFFATTAAFANELFAAPNDSKTPNRALQNLADTALREAKRLKASYCDIRINRYREQGISIRLSPERGTSKTLEVPEISDTDSFGFGVRVIVNGAWGFASSPRVVAAEITRITQEAVAVAKANATIKPRLIVLAPTKAYIDRWTSPFERNPFEVPIPEKLTLLTAVAREVKKERRVLSSNASLNFRSEDKYFASSEGSSIQQLIIHTSGSATANAVDVQKRLSKSRSYIPTPLSTGYEFVPQMNMTENARRIREEVVEHLAAPPVRPGKKDLVLMPSHLFLTIHESIGHPTELDRALGYEANYAGTSYLTLDKLRKARIASDIVNIFGDRTTERGLATVAYDDDGVKTMKFPIVSKGIFSGYQTIRDQAHIIGEKESRGCCYADSWSSVPFQRMPNVSMEAGTTDLTVEDLIGGIEDGILIEGRGSYSIDQQRYNFQFGGDAFWEIKGGKKRGMISQVAYQARSPDFWTACDGIAGPSYWQMYGSARDGKGEPTQINSMSHGCSPSRFRSIDVIGTD